MASTLIAEDNQSTKSYTSQLLKIMALVNMQWGVNSTQAGHTNRASIRLEQSISDQLHTNTERSKLVLLAPNYENTHGWQIAFTEVQCS